MADARRRGRSPPRRRSRDPWEGPSEARYSPVRDHRTPRSSRSPDRDGRSRRASRRYEDSPYNIPNENNYRPVYSSPPPIRHTSVSGSRRGSSTHTPTYVAPNLHSNSTTSTGKGEVRPVQERLSFGNIGSMASENGQQHHQEVAQELGTMFRRFMEESTDYQALKIQKRTAQKEVDRRTKDFQKSEYMHEKFPATAESQTKAQDRAKTAFRTISEQCSQKESSLNDLAMLSATRIIPCIVAATTAHGLIDGQSREDELRRKCETLQKQLEEQQRFIEELQKFQKSGEKKFSALDENYSKTRNDWEQTKISAMQLEKDCRPKLAQILDKAQTTDNEVTTLRNETRQLQLDLSGLTNKTLQFSDLRPEVDKIKRDSLKTSKDLGDHIKNIGQLEDYHGKVNKQEHIILQLLGDRTDLLNRVTELKAAEDATAKALAGLEASSAPRSKLEAVEKQLLGFSNLIKKISSLEETMSKFDSGLRIVEARNPWTTAVAPADNPLSRISFLEKRIPVIDTLEKSNFDITSRYNTDMAMIKKVMHAMKENSERLTDMEKSLQPQAQKVSDNLPLLERAPPRTVTPTIGLPSGTDFDTLKIEVLEVVEAKQEASDEVIQAQLQSSFQGLHDRCAVLEKSCAEMKALYGPVSDLPREFEKLQVSFDSRLQQQHDSAAHRVVGLIRTKPDILPLAAIENHVSKSLDIDNKLDALAKRQQNLSRDFSEQLEANTQGLVSIDKRMGNINTKDMAMFILGQMDATYPDLRTAQNAVAGLTLSHQRNEVIISNIMNSVTALKAQADALETRTLQSNPDETPSQQLRNEVDDLTQHILKTQGSANAAKRAADTVNETIAALELEYNKFQAEIAEEVGKLRVDLEEMKEQQPPKAAASLSVPSISIEQSSTSLSPTLNDRSPNRLNPRPSASSHTHSSARDRGPKKRKVDNPAFQNGTGTATKELNGNPRKRPWNPNDGDDSEDSFFEPNQPQISDDDIAG